MPWMVSQRLCAVPDRVADDGAAAHRVAAQVVVQGVAAEHVLLAEVAELGVADRAGRVAVVHRVAAHAFGVGRLDDDVAAQVRHLAAVLAVAQVARTSSGLSSVSFVPSIGLDDVAPRCATRVFAVAVDVCVPVTMTRSPTFQPVTGSASVTALSPFFAVAPSLTQVRLSGAPWKSMRPPQQTMAGHDSLSMPST